MMDGSTGGGSNEAIQEWLMNSMVGLIAVFCVAAVLLACLCFPVKNIAEKGNGAKPNSKISQAQKGNGAKPNSKISQAQKGSVAKPNSKSSQGQKGSVAKLNSVSTQTDDISSDNVHFMSVSIEKGDVGLNNC